MTTEENPSDVKPRVLRVGLVGAGEAGQLFLKVIRNDREVLGYDPVIFFDDAVDKRGETIDGVLVDGPISILPELIVKYALDLILITMPSVSGRIIKRIVDLCSESSISYRVVPPAYTNLQISGIKRPRKVSIEDLINIRPKSIIDESVISSLKSEIILVTGAAGSIGSEIVKQLVTIQPKSILALDISESGLYDLGNNLISLNPDVPIEILLCDIRNKKKLLRIFKEYRPTLIFHAAAYKHVPMLEKHPDEAIATNVLGTLNLIESMSVLGPSRLVVISTDKAVEPCNVMGMTKKLVEMLVKCSLNNEREMLVVRFGNVLESNGSVIPLFRKQIENGGPVTVTHPDVERYFMTTFEAAQLVIQTALIGKNGRTYVLHMGEQKKIIDIAKDLILLSDLKEGRDIEIIFTGLRPGERLSEKLFNAEEKGCLIENSMIYEIEDEREKHCKQFLEEVQNLLKSYDNNEADDIKKQLEALVDSLKSK